jgi:transposase-like protein
MLQFSNGGGEVRRWTSRVLTSRKIILWGVRGKWAYLYHAVDKDGHTVDFLRPPHRDRAAAEAFLRKAIGS